MEAFRAVLFDLDGVVIDTRQSVTDFLQAVAAEQNVTLTAEDFDNYIHKAPANPWPPWPLGPQPPGPGARPSRHSASGALGFPGPAAS